MADSPQDWTTWIVTTLLAAVTTMVGTVVFLAKLIESRYTTEIKELKSGLLDMAVKHADCLQKHHEAELRLARLETKVASNTKQLEQK